jgi:N-acetylneuraminic acid mutarotase
MANKAKIMSLVFIFTFLAALAILPSTSAASPSEDSWVSRASMQVARGGLGVAVVDGKIYAIGGYPGIGQTLTTNEEYDPKTDTWTFKAPSSVPLAFFGITVTKTKSTA